MLSMIGLLGGLILLIILTLRGVNLFIAAPICALLVALSSGMAIFPVSADTNFINAYMDGFAGFLSAWFFMFLLGSLFGKFMEDTGAVTDMETVKTITKLMDQSGYIEVHRPGMGSIEVKPQSRNPFQQRFNVHGVCA